MATQKRAWLAGMAFAAILGIVVGISLPRLLTIRLADHPSGAWDSHAIRSSFAGLKVAEVNLSTAALTISYDLDNTTGADFQLEKAPSLVIMSRLKSDGALSSDQTVTLTSPEVFVPARNRTRIALEIVQPFNWPASSDMSGDSKFRNLVADTVGSLSGFVLFDEKTHFQIDLPAGWPDLQKSSPGRANGQ